MTEGDFTRRAKGYEREANWIMAPEFIEPLVPPVYGGGKMLDVCAGTGVIAEYAAALGWRCWALDRNQAMLDGVDGTVIRVVGDAHRMPFGDDSFDLVVCRQGLQYLEPSMAIAEMLRVSRSQVRLLHGFVGQVYTDLWQELFAISGRPGRDFFSDTMLDQAIEACGPGKWTMTRLTSRIWFAVKPEYRKIVENFLHAHPSFVGAHRVELEVDGFWYDLMWACHIIAK